VGCWHCDELDREEMMNEIAKFWDRHDRDGYDTNRRTVSISLLVQVFRVFSPLSRSRVSMYYSITVCKPRNRFYLH
jgi:hypothetical protein